MTEMAKLVNDARKPFFSVFLDGRNEHGSHVLAVPGDSIGDTDLIRPMLINMNDQSTGLAEQIISEAESLGHQIGHCVITLWSAEGGDESGTWFEYLSVSVPLTNLFFGDSREQEERFAMAEGR